MNRKLMAVIYKVPVISGSLSSGGCDMMELTCTKFVIFIDTQFEMSSIITNCGT